MSNKEKIIDLFYSEHSKPVDIALKLNVSNAYVSKVIKKDSRYHEEKSQRKQQEEKSNQEYNKKIFKKSYLNENGYVCVNTDGSILKPDYVSHKFNQILKDNNLKSIRFHDLRHSCASLLLSNKVSMKDIQYG